MLTAVNWRLLLQSAISARISSRCSVSITYAEPTTVIRVSRIGCVFVVIWCIFLLAYTTYQNACSEKLMLKSSYRRSTRNFLNAKAHQRSATKHHVPWDLQEPRAWPHFPRISRGKALAGFSPLLLHQALQTPTAFGFESSPKSKA